MKEKKVWIIGAVIVFLALYAIGSSDTPNVELQSTKTQPSLELQPTEIPAYSNNEYKQSYMEGCIDEGGNYEYCNCTYDYLLNKYGLEKLLEISVEYIKTEDIGEERKFPQTYRLTGLNS